MENWHNAAMAWGLISCVLALVIVLFFHIFGLGKNIGGRYIELIVDALLIIFGAISGAFFTKELDHFPSAARQGQWWDKYLTSCILMWCSIALFCVSFLLDMCKVKK
jgi:uncharacterized membrane protein